jgi:serine/threonine protein kinase/TPR repeat protein
VFKAGERIDRYEIQDPIAAGGMGVVYRARHTNLGNEVALKVLSDTYALNEKVRHRFRQEAYVQSQLTHPNIVSVYDLLVEETLLALVMPLIKGPSLAVVNEEEKPGAWSISEALPVWRAVTEAVAYAHDRGVVHRDLKPGNVLMNRHDDPGLGRPMVCDFGLAKVLSDSAAMTKVGAQMGTMPYMAPEQFQGTTDITPAADVFALGVLLWRLLAGKLPVDPENMEECLTFYLDGAQPSLYAPKEGGEGTLDALIERAMMRDPSKRFPNAGALVAALEASERGQAPDSPATPAVETPTEPGEHTGARKWWLVGVAGTIVIALIASFGPSLFGPKSPKDGEKKIKTSAGAPVISTPAAQRACEGGDGDACLREGLAHYFGVQRPVDFVAAARSLSRGCEAENGRACVGIGDLLRDGRGRPPDFKASLDRYRRGCDLGWGESCYRVAVAYMDGVEVTEDTKQTQSFLAKGTKALMRACTKRDPYACGVSGHALMRGLGHEKDVEAGKKQLARAATLYEKACEDGAQLACYFRAEMQVGKWGAPKNSVQGRAGHEATCTAGVVASCSEWAAALTLGQGGPKDVNRARTLREESCRKGHPSSCFLLGKLRADAARYEDAIKLAEKACALGNTGACSGVHMWIQRHVKPPDEARQRRALAQGCLRRDGLSCFGLGKMLVTGKGGPQDLAAGRTAFRTGCKVGEGEACLSVANMMWSGKGGIVDKDQATINYMRACNLKADVACSKAAIGLMKDKNPPRAKSALAREMVLKGCDMKNVNSCELAAAFLINGVGGAKNTRGGRSLLEPLCEKGRAFSCYWMGQYHSNGAFGYRNRYTAIRFLRKGCKLGSKDACNHALLR